MNRIALVAARELRAERRQPDGIVAATTFIAVLVLLESLVVGPVIARDADVAAALFWIALAFATILTTMRSFDRELEDDALDALVALPGGRDALFGGKVLALTAMLLLVAAVGGILSLVLLDLPLALPIHLAIVVLFGVVALPPVVIVDVILALRLRARAALVPILALPVLVPQLVAATRGASAALVGDDVGALSWAGLLFAFAVVYTVIGAIESEEYQRTIQEIIRKHDLADSVRLVGPQPDQVLIDALQAADMVVNLRYPYLGESSWSLLEALFAGKPTIVWRHGYYDEFPDDVSTLRQSAHIDGRPYVRRQLHRTERARRSEARRRRRVPRRNDE